MATETKQKAKFKVGDYICGPDIVFLEILTVLPGIMPIYGARSPKKWDKVQWHSEYELDEMGMEKGEPEFDLFNTIEAGDVLRDGSSDSRDYLTVLARVDKVVLLSASPDKNKTKVITALSDQIKEMTDGEIDPMHDFLDDDDRSQIRKMASTRHTSKIATEWRSLDMLARMHWTLIRE